MTLDGLSRELMHEMADFLLDGLILAQHEGYFISSSERTGLLEK